MMKLKHLFFGTFALVLLLAALSACSFDNDTPDNSTAGTDDRAPVAEDTADTSSTEDTGDTTKDSAHQPPAGEYSYIGNRETKIFHKVICPLLPDDEKRVYFTERAEAIDESYTPCAVCGA